MINIFLSFCMPYLINAMMISHPRQNKIVFNRGIKEYALLFRSWDWIKYFKALLMESIFMLIFFAWL